MSFAEELLITINSIYIAYIITSKIIRISLYMYLYYNLLERFRIIYNDTRTCNGDNNN